MLLMNWGCRTASAAALLFVCVRCKSSIVVRMRISRLRIFCFVYVALAGVLALQFAVAQQTAPLDTSTDVLVTVHADRTTGAHSPIWNFFGADEPNYLYAPNGQKLLHELSALSPVPVYFRAHNLFTTGNGEGSLKWGSTNVYTENADGSPVYDFTITDRIFDALMAAHVRPLVEIGFMPEALSTHPEPYRHTFPKGDIFTGWTYPPKSEKKWASLVKAYAVHLKERYGTQVDTWLWEVWNEPDIPYWHGTWEQYDRLYDISASAIRSVLPHARIGGPEATGISDHSAPFLKQFLDHCAHGRNAATGGMGAPLDFISYHPKGHPEFVDGHVVMSVAAQLRAVERGMEIIAADPRWRHTPIILGESDPEGCAACKGTQNGYRNGPLYGVSVVEATMRTYELARRHNLKVEGAVTWAFEFEDQPAFAGFRSLATDGIDKAVLNAFRMMGKLGGAGTEWLAVDSNGALPLEQVLKDSVRAKPDVNAVATMHAGEINVLLWNYHDADVEAPPAKILLAMDGLKSAQVEETEFRMDHAHSNAYAGWQKMGSPAQPAAEQVEELQKAGALEETVAAHPVEVHGGKVNFALTIPRQGVVLVQLRQN